MAISYPLSVPTTAVAARLRWTGDSVVGFQASPFTKQQKVYAHQGEALEVEVQLPPMDRADAEEWVGFLLALNGQEGTFLMGDPVGATPRGTWLYGSPQAGVSGAHAAGVKTLALKDFASGATGKVGDWIQFGSGSSTHLHKVVQDFAASGAGAATVEIWPRTRAALADGDGFVVQGAVGQWRLASNRRTWEVQEAQEYGISFSAIEAL